ncbi:MAG TPA: DUF2007 domain-containing protein [Terriglobales bacterium]|nr:DUF2007 domain-containing protein [Terriglobales bacterium]
MNEAKNPNSELVEVFDTQDESEAMVIQSLLDSAGIESLMTNLDAPQDVLPGVGGVVLRVTPDVAEEARRVIEEYKNNPATDAQILSEGPPEEA